MPEVICTIVRMDGEQEALYGPDGALLWVAEWPWDGRGISTHKYRDAGCTAVRHRTVADDWDWPTDENYEPVWPETIDGIALEEVE